MINTTIFELIEGLKIIHRYDGNPVIKTGENFIKVKLSAISVLKSKDIEQLTNLRWYNYENQWSLKL